MFWRKKPSDSKKKRRKKKRRRRSRSATQRTLENFVVEEIELAAVPAVGPSGSPMARRRGRRQVATGFRFAFAWFGLWVLIVTAGLVTRGLLPPDEARLQALVWEMWIQGDWWLPRLNGEYRFQQPPLSLWMVLAGWQLWGVNDWLPRLLPALYGLLAMVLTSIFARIIWPDQKQVIRYAPMLLLATGLWAMYLTFAATDLLLVCTTLVALIAVFRLMQGGRGSLVMLVAAIAAGMFSGGPVSLVYVVPAMVLAPVWAGSTRVKGWGNWYRNVALAMLLGTALWGGWLYLVAGQADSGWQEALLAAAGMQSMTLFYQHGSWWWYLYLIPVVLFPWSVWPLGWMRLWQVRSRRLDSGFTLCMVWGVSAIVLLILLPVRQPQMLLPMFPAYILVLTWLLMHDDLRTVGEDSFFAGMTFPVIAIGFLLAILPGLPQLEFLPAFLWNMSPFIGIAVAALGIAFSWMPHMDTGKRIISIAVTTMFVVVVGNFVIGYQLGDRYRTPQLNTLLYETENQGRKIAIVGRYQGEFHFQARLTQAITVLTRDQTRQWILDNPTSVMMAMDDTWQPTVISDSALLLEQAYGVGQIRVWDAGLLMPSP